MNKPEPKRDGTPKKKPWTREDFLRDLQKVVQPVEEPKKKKRV